MLHRILIKPKVSIPNNLTKYDTVIKISNKLVALLCKENNLPGILFRFNTVNDIFYDIIHCYRFLKNYTVIQASAINR